MSRVICLQPALPHYRIDFFERCYRLLGDNFTVYYSSSDLHGLETNHDEKPQWSIMLGPVSEVLPGVHWQKNALGIPIKKGDVVIVAGAPRCLSNLLVLVCARLRGARIIWWGHYWSSTSKYWRCVIRLAFMRLSHMVIFYTDREVDECRLHSPRFAPTRMHALNNGLNADAIVTSRIAYDSELRGQRLIFIGRLTVKAQMRLLIEALADPRLSEVTLEVVGGGPEEASLRKLTKNLGLCDRVVWNGVITDENIISRVANRCSMFVYPGSVGLSLIHGMTYGLPAVIHDNRWHHMPEVSAFKADATGFTFEEGSVASLSEVLVKALADQVRLAEMSQCSLDTVRDSFNTADMSRRFVAAIKELRDESL